ncbi:hypothetical protein L873DRAFT_1823336 [Choiromyces venosus 120613-1]|uniref:Uncharacterized protein n=1 Tax=Choiromyces venosus 120613-1 TaxID=1336337 RepID=A0A3N4ITU7_9PEZI|nr:hypothetical protein L873DRAFT_1823336 [Choiromyces venosus 120613-1]
MFSGGTDYPIPNLGSSHQNNNQTRKSALAARYHGRRAKKSHEAVQYRMVHDRRWSQVLGGE